MNDGEQQQQAIRTDRDVKAIVIVNESYLLFYINEQKELKKLERKRTKTEREMAEEKRTGRKKHAA
jgi:hypothetical protein